MMESGIENTLPNSKKKAILNKTASKSYKTQCCMHLGHVLKEIAEKRVSRPSIKNKINKLQGCSGQY